MKCDQCDRPAIFMIGDQNNIPLCLHCYAKWSHVQDIQFLKSAVMMNNAMDQMDMVAGMVAGITTGGRLPVHSLASAMQRSHTLNNFNISQSQIGVLNTGSIKKIDAAITLSKGSDAEVIAQQLKELTEAVISSQELQDAQKNELLDLTETLAEEVVGKRKPATISVIMAAIKEKVDSIASLVTSADRLMEAIRGIMPPAE